MTSVARVAIVFGSYNRLELLMRAIRSVRKAVGGYAYQIVVVDGGSTDGSRQWLPTQEDVVLIQQEGPLTGAVKAFNLGFAYAVDQGFDYVCHLNDDARFVTPRAIASAIEILVDKPKVGEVAFEFNLRGPWGFEHVNGVPYANYGVIRMEAGIAVAKAQGDPTGRDWWNPIYRTYGADTEFGVWLWKLYWTVYEGKGLRVHDSNAQDDLRVKNASKGPKMGDSELFWSRWRNEVLPPPKEQPAPPPLPVIATPPIINARHRGGVAPVVLPSFPVIIGTRKKKATWIVGSHLRPQLLEACLLTLRDGIWPEDWTYEVIVGHHKDDAASEAIAKKLGAITIGTSGMAPGQKRNAALRIATGELIMVTDDDDFQSPLRPGLAIAAYESGWALSGIREFRRLHLPEGHVVRWHGRGNHEGIGVPPVYCGTARNYRKDLLVAMGGWRPLPSLEDSDLHRRILRRTAASTKRRRELDLGNQLAESTIILQHGANIFARPSVATGKTELVGKYVCTGEGHWSTLPNFPVAVAERLGSLLQGPAPIVVASGELEIR